MASRKDLLKAHSFTTRRLVGTLTNRDPDSPIGPLRRVGTATFISVMITIVMVAGSAVLGFLKIGGSKNWQQASVVIQDIDSGVLFAYLKDDKSEQEVLVPMSDMASARLMVSDVNAANAPKVVNVRSEHLKGVTQARLHGIPGAPRQLPSSKAMNPWPIKACSTAPRSDGHRFLSIQIGEGSVPEQSHAIVAVDSNDQQYMILNGVSHRLMQVPGGDSPLRENLPLITPGDAWIASLPAGQAIEPIKIPDAGQIPAAKRVNQLLIGQLAMVPGDSESAPRYYVQVSDGLARTTYLDMRAWQADNERLGDPARISNATAAAAVSEKTPELMTQGLPDGKPVGPPGLASLSDKSICATYTDKTGQNPLISVGDETPQAPADQPEPIGHLADIVVLEQLSGALIANSTSTSKDTATFLITSGRRYGIPSGGQRRALGYPDNVQVAKLSPDLIKLIPSGLPPRVELSKSSIVQLG